MYLKKDQGRGKNLIHICFKKKHVGVFLGFIFFFTFIISCKPKKEGFEVIKKTNGLWDKKQALSLEFTPEKNTYYDSYFILSYNHSYEFRNLFLFIEIHYPNHKIFKDTLEYELQDEKARWKGTGIGSLKRILLDHKKLSFKEEKPHKIIIFHGMRKRELKGIENISLVLEKVK